jgi:hypothetical protein
VMCGWKRVNNLDQSERRNKKHTDRVFVYTRLETLDHAAGFGAIQHRVQFI